MPDNENPSGAIKTPQDSDQISLDESLRALPEAGSEASSQDTIINAAEMFNAQLEQMTAWKHQLAQQMEMMRRDGIKLLERQKNLAIEKKRATEERETLAAEHQRLKQLQIDTQGETSRLAARAAELEASHAALRKLQEDKENWERELAQTRHEAESLAARRSQAESDLAVAETRLQEIHAIETRRDELLEQVSGAEVHLSQLDADRHALDSARHDLDLRHVELQARQKSVAEQESRCREEEARLKEGFEHLETQRRQLGEAQRQAAQDIEGSNVRQQQLAERDQTLARLSQELAAREDVLKIACAENRQANSALLAKQAELADCERILAEKTRAAETDLQARLSAAEQFRHEAGEERLVVLKQRQELQRKLDALDQEQAEQHETLAKQSKRLAERRAEVEAAEHDIEKALEGRIGQATEALHGELARKSQEYQQRITQLEQQIAQNESAAGQSRAAEAQLRQELADAQGQLTIIREELARAAVFPEQLQHAGESAALARNELNTLKIQHATLKTTHESLEYQLELQAEEGQKILETIKRELRKEIAARDEEISQWKEKCKSMLTAGKNDAKSRTPIEELNKQIQMLEQQRNDLAAQLFAVQDAFKNHQEESLLANNALKNELIRLREHNITLEMEKTTWQSHEHNTAESRINAPDRPVSSGQRERLLRQAKVLRATRRQTHEFKATLENSRREVAQQREQLRSRRENLEQVKRLLEKQEMVMARKLADHNAIKSVAAVGIFVIMVLGSAFIGVYRFVHPVYQSEAMVQLAPPADLQGSKLAEWMDQQKDYFRSNEVTLGAWKVLRSADEHYSMHDVREEWIASFDKHLSLQADPASRSVAIRYTGQDAEGVAQVSNALATAYSVPGARESTDATRNFGLGSQIIAKATVPMTPLEDNRMMISLSVVAIVLFVSLLLVVLFRHFVTRQLREIDQMADAQDLEDANLTEGPQPT